MEEEWRAIKEYEGLYEISNLGRVKSLGNNKSRKEKILKTRNHRQGYLFVRLYKNRKFKDYTVHRLVLQTFNPNPDIENLEVNHIDEDKTNNRLENLEWVTCEENCNHGTRNKRVAEKLSLPIVQLTKEGKFIKAWKSTMEAEREGGFTQQNITACCKGRLKTHGGFRWCYLYEYISKIDTRIKKVILLDKEYLVN